jgi:hypothetical protein
MTITSHFQIEPQIIQVINNLALAGLKTVGDETLLAGRKSVLDLLPAAILFTGDGAYSNGTDGKLQTETQYWQLSVMVKHIRGDVNGTTASQAGEYITPILAALVGWVASADFAPLEIVQRIPGEYREGYAEFPFVLKTSFDVGPNA